MARPGAGAVVSNSEEASLALARAGIGLYYAFEPDIAGELERGELEIVLDAYAARIPGFFSTIRAGLGSPLRFVRSSIWPGRTVQDGAREGRFEVVLQASVMAFQASKAPSSCCLVAMTASLTARPDSVMTLSVEFA